MVALIEVTTLAGSRKASAELPSPEPPTVVDSISGETSQGARVPEGAAGALPGGSQRAVGRATGAEGVEALPVPAVHRRRRRDASWGPAGVN